jgi:hypothetical protein
MSYFIFLKYLRSLEEFRKNPCVKIPPKSRCANFQSLGIFKNLVFYLKKNLPQISAHPTQPRPRWPALPRRPPDPRSAHSAQAALAYLLKGVFTSTLRIPVKTPSLSHVTAMWAPPVSFIPFPTPADLTHGAASPHRLRPPCAARPPTTRYQARSSLPTLIPPFNSPLNPSLSRPPSMVLRPLPPAVSPFLTPACPSLAPIKG